MRILINFSSINSQWPSDAIWCYRSGTTLAQVIACCLMAPSHYLNQCWLIMSKVRWHSSKGNFARDTSSINYQNHFENYFSKISPKSPRGQRFNCISNNNPQNSFYGSFPFKWHWFQNKTMAHMFIVNSDISHTTWTVTGNICIRSIDWMSPVILVNERLYTNILKLTGPLTNRILL